MITHPIVLAVLGCDLGAALLLLFAAGVAARVVVAWAPESASRAQLRLERRVEVSDLAARFAALLFVAGTLIFVVAVAGVLPTLVPGAMCGTGVLQATAGQGERALGLRVLGLLLLAARGVTARLDDADPRAPCARTVARLLLLATPVAVLAALDTWRALSALDVHTPVDCCAVVYDQLGAAGPADSGPGDPATWAVASLAAGAVLLAAALFSLLGATGRPTLRAGALALAALVWTPIAARSLIEVWASYHYGVLQHRCPWCLFLGEHGFAGYPLLLALWLVLCEGPASWLAAVLGARHPGLAAAASRRSARASWLVLAGLLVFAALTWGPALAWRVRHGVWLHG